MKRPPELFEFLKPSAKVSEERSVRRSLKYWRLTNSRSASAPAPPEAARPPEPSPEPRRARVRRPEPPREEPPAPKASKPRGPLVLTPRVLAAAAILLVAVVGLAYVVGKGGLVSSKGAALRMDAVGDHVWTVQVFHLEGTGATQHDNALRVIDFFRGDDEFKSLGLELSAVQVRGAEETRVYLGRASTKDDPALLDALQRVQKCVVKHGPEKAMPFKSARIREWGDTTKS
jgi:hypothetical protein